jgi:hypothetical protein
MSISMCGLKAGVPYMRVIVAFFVLSIFLADSLST